MAPVRGRGPVGSCRGDAAEGDRDDRCTPPRSTRRTTRRSCRARCAATRSAPRTARCCARSTPSAGAGCGAAAYVVYAAVLLAIVIVDGVPTGRATLAVMIVTGLALTSIGHGWRQTLRVVARLVAVHRRADALRPHPRVADTLGVPLHEADILARREVAVRRGRADAVAAAAPVQPGTTSTGTTRCARWSTPRTSWPRRSSRPCCGCASATLWLRFISRVIVLSVAGLITYCLFPEAPPWLAAPRRAQRAGRPPVGPRLGLVPPRQRQRRAGPRAGRTGRNAGRGDAVAAHRVRDAGRDLHRHPAALALALAARAVPGGDGLHPRLLR